MNKPSTKNKTTKKESPAGLNQKFKGKDGKLHTLKSVLKDGDWWETNGRNKMTMLTHDAVKRIANKAGFVVVDYSVLTQPTIYNNMECVIMVEMQDKDGNKLEPELGEANRNNLGRMGNRNPMNMTQKRAYDRTVLFNLGITGILSDEEIPKDDETREKTMENLTHEERQKIAPLISQLMLAKTKINLAYFDKAMPENKKKMELNEEQVEYIKKLYMKRLVEIGKNPKWSK